MNASPSEGYPSSMTQLELLLLPPPNECQSIRGVPQQYDTTRTTATPPPLMNASPSEGYPSSMTQLELLLLPPPLMNASPSEGYPSSMTQLELLLLPPPLMNASPSEGYPSSIYLRDNGEQSFLTKETIQQ